MSMTETRWTETDRQRPPKDTPIIWIDPGGQERRRDLRGWCGLVSARLVNVHLLSAEVLASRRRRGGGRGGRVKRLYHRLMCVYYRWRLRHVMARFRRNGERAGLPSLAAYTDEEIIAGLRDLRKHPTAEEVERRIVERMKRFTEKLERGDLIEATEVKVEHTPDGTLTTRRKAYLDTDTRQT